MCEGRLVRDVAAPIYPVAQGGLRLNPPRGALEGSTLSELRPGTLERDAVFLCTPTDGGRYVGELHRIVVQVRTGVSVRVGSLDAARHADVHDQVAIGDPPELPYTWVQTGHLLPERISYFGGRTETRETDLRRRPPSFDEGGERWWVDSSSDYTARYAGTGLALGTLGHSGGEIIYDAPDVQRAYGGLLGAEPNIREIDASVQFRTYLYQRPGGYHGIASLDALVVVEWWYTQIIGRDEPGGPARVFDDRTKVRVMWILPNPIEPPDLDASIRSRFQFG